MITHSHQDLATSLNLWREYVDPDIAFSDEEFYAMSVEQRMAQIVAAFGPEETVPTVESMLESTAVGCGRHDWSVEGGSVMVDTATLRHALEMAYDDGMADWPALVDLAE